MRWSNANPSASAHSPTANVAGRMSTVTLTVPANMANAMHTLPPAPRRRTKMQMLPPSKRPKPRRPPSPYYGNYRPAPTDAELSELPDLYTNWLPSDGWETPKQLRHGDE